MLEYSKRLIHDHPDVNNNLSHVSVLAEQSTFTGHKTPLLVSRSINKIRASETPHTKDHLIKYLIFHEPSGLDQDQTLDLKCA